MAELETKKSPLPDSFTQSQSGVSVIDLKHFEDQVSDKISILRAGDKYEVGSFEPVTVVLRPLGSPFFYRVESYELTPYGCVIFCDDSEGRKVNLTAGSSLVDALIILPLSDPQINSADKNTESTADNSTSHIHFIGKVTEKVFLSETVQMHNELQQKPDQTGYVIRFSQITLREQEELRKFLSEKQRAPEPITTEAPTRHN